MQRIKSGLTALAVGIVLLAALDWAAAAATGQSLVLGKWNQADQTTTIKNVGTGPALDIRAKGPAFAVHNANRIKNLNADKLDGKDSAHLVTDTTPTYDVLVSEVVGTDLVAEPTASCDSGDRLQYGGHANLSPAATVMESVGNNASSWRVEINGVNTNDGVTTRIRCYDFPPLRP